MVAALASVNMCTYAVLETVDYFLRRGSKVFMCTMDMTKSFDVTVHSLLSLLKVPFSMLWHIAYIVRSCLSCLKEGDLVAGLINSSLVFCVKQRQHLFCPILEWTAI